MPGEVGALFGRRTALFSAFVALKAMMARTTQSREMVEYFAQPPSGGGAMSEH